MLQEPPTAWRVLEQETNLAEAFKEFVELPVCTVLSTSQVARNFAVDTEQGDYVEFGEQKRWIPQVELFRVRAPLPLAHEIIAALDDGLFKHKLLSFRTRDRWQISTSSIEALAEVAWASSSAALHEVLYRVICDDYKADFIVPQAQREERLAPLVEALEALAPMEEAKLAGLVKILEERRAGGEKAVIFTELHATAIHLEQTLKRHTSLRVACVVKEIGKGKYKLKDFDKEVFQLLCDFAPEANRDKLSLLPRAHQPQPYDVFITTDAYGAGVNLQDASVVISYDLAWTADTIIQRAGRVLRFWPEARRVSFFVFVPALPDDGERAQRVRHVEQRLARLTSRSHAAIRFSELPILPEAAHEEYPSLGALAAGEAAIEIDPLGLAEISEIEEFTGSSSFLRHLAVQSQERARAEALPNDIASAMNYGGRFPLLYLLLRYENKLYWLLYEPHLDRVSESGMDKILNLIACQPDTPLALVSADAIEQLSQKARARWAATLPESRDEVQAERLCALYLVPHHVARPRTACFEVLQVPDMQAYLFASTRFAEKPPTVEQRAPHALPNRPT